MSKYDYIKKRLFYVFIWYIQGNYISITFRRIYVFNMTIIQQISTQSQTSNLGVTYVLYYAIYLISFQLLFCTCL